MCRSARARGLMRQELEATEEAPANLAYTRYVLEAGYSGDFLDLMAALALACWAMAKSARGWRAVAGHMRHGSTPMAAAEYQGLCHDVGALIDGARLHTAGAGLGRKPARFARLARALPRPHGWKWDSGIWGLTGA
jgi:thiaminase (transcriptional activator TenA)